MEVEDVHLEDGCLDCEDHQKMDGSRPPTALAMKKQVLKNIITLGWRILENHMGVISKTKDEIWFAFQFLFSHLCSLIHKINKTSILCTTILYSQQCNADLENIAIILKPGRQLLEAYACGISGYGHIITSHDINVKKVQRLEW